MTGRVDDARSCARWIEALRARRLASAFTAACLLSPLAAALPAAAQEGGKDWAVGEAFRECGVCPEMAVVPAGSFMMGSLPRRRGPR